MSMVHRGLRPRWWWIALPALATYAAFWAYRLVVARFGALAMLVLVLATIPIVLVGVALLWHAFGDRITGGVAGVVRALWSPVETSSWYRASRARHPGIWRATVDRLDPHLATGLGFSVLLLAAGGALWAFGAVLLQVISPSSMTIVDHRIVNLFQMLRTPGGDRIMLDATYIGSGRSVGALTAAAVIVALLLRRRRDALLVVASLAAGTAFSRSSS